MTASCASEISIRVQSESQCRSAMCNSLRPRWLYRPGNSLGQNAGMGSLSLQGIFPPQGLNSGLPHCRQILYCLSHQQSPRILERVAYPFSRGSSQPRNRTGDSCIVSGFFTNELPSTCQIKYQLWGQGIWDPGQRHSICLQCSSSEVVKRIYPLPEYFQQGTWQF